MLEWRVICNNSSSLNAPQGVEKGTVIKMAYRGLYVKFRALSVDKRYEIALFSLNFDNDVR